MCLVICDIVKSHRVNRKSISCHSRVYCNTMVGTDCCALFGFHLQNDERMAEAVINFSCVREACHTLPPPLPFLLSRLQKKSALPSHISRFELLNIGVDMDRHWGIQWIGHCGRQWSIHWIIHFSGHESGQWSGQWNIHFSGHWSGHGVATDVDMEWTLEWVLDCGADVGVDTDWCSDCRVRCPSGLKLINLWKEFISILCNTVHKSLHMFC